MIDFANTFIYSDQPTTCPKCGLRTKIILDFSHTNKQTQIHKCYSENCLYEFVVQNNFEFAEPL